MLRIHSYHKIPDKDFLTIYKRIESKISDPLKAKTKSFRFSEDQQRSLAGELMVRKFYKEYLGQYELEFELNEHNKPFLSGVEDQYFNISHSGNFVVGAFSDQAVGIDVEMIGKDRRAIAKRYFTEEEITQMQTIKRPKEQIDFFYRLWTLKESYMKALGMGMSMSLSSFSFQVLSNGIVLEYSKHDQNWVFYSQLWKQQAYLSLCSKSNEKPEIIEVNAEDLFDL